MSRAAAGRVAPPLALAALVLVLWQTSLLNAAIGVQRFVLPPPSAILGALWQGRGVLLQALSVTAGAAALGYAIGNLLGVAVGFAASARASRLVGGTAIAFGAAQGIPLVAVIPLVGLVLGSGLAFKLVVVTIITAPLTGYYLVRGAATAERRLGLLFDVYGTSRWRRFLALVVPGAAGYAFIALRANSVLALVGVVVCEFIAGSGGLGYQIEAAFTSFQAPAGWAASAVLMALGLAWYELVALAERSLGGRFQY
jgi:NitT/TauT family transport system permease protein